MILQIFTILKKEWLLIFRNVLLALIVIAIGQSLPPLQALENWMAPRRSMLIWLTGGAAALGWLFFMGAVFYRIATGGGPLKRNEIEAHIKSVKDGQSIPYSSRVSNYWVPKKAWGGGFSDEMSIAQFKAAWAHGLWRHDPRWRGIFIMAFGALLMLVGGFGAGVVLCAPGLKLLFGAALVFALFRITWAFWHA